MRAILPPVKFTIFGKNGAFSPINSEYKGKFALIQYSGYYVNPPPEATSLWTDAATQERFANL